ncbi:MAG: LamB/YcsF family protein [Candidatus Dormibacteraeota bacterium]|nr:LamB/YcsF family protein [Candidatus Dormibacteraeota bacterium]
MSRVVDVNADVGEGADDEKLMPFLTSCSIACGGHTGDIESMLKALRLGRDHGLLMGGHPGYPDREGFGRREWSILAADLFLSLASQLDALGVAALQVEVDVTHVKTHGSLYDKAWRDDETATVVARAVLAWSPEVALICPPGSAQEAAAKRLDVLVIREAFADRRYTADGTLVPRSEPGAVISDPSELKDQLSNIAGLEFDTLCFHSDNPAAADLLAALPGVIEELGWEIGPYPIP